MAAEVIASEDKLISPLSVRFAQDHVRTTFRDGRKLDDALKQVKALPGYGHYDAILTPPFPKISIARFKPSSSKDGKESEHWFTLDNRRLYVMQQAAVALWPKTVGMVVEVLDEAPGELQRKYSSTSRGIIAYASVKSNCPPSAVWNWRVAVDSERGPVKQSDRRVVELIYKEDQISTAALLVDTLDKAAAVILGRGLKLHSDSLPDNILPEASAVFRQVPEVANSAPMPSQKPPGTWLTRPQNAVQLNLSQHLGVEPPAHEALAHAEVQENSKKEEDASPSALLQKLMNLMKADSEEENSGDKAQPLLKSEVGGAPKSGAQKMSKYEELKAARAEAKQKRGASRAERLRLRPDKLAAFLPAEEDEKATESKASEKSESKTPAPSQTTSKCEWVPKLRPDDKAPKTRALPIGSNTKLQGKQSEGKDRKKPSKEASGRWKRKGAEEEQPELEWKALLKRLQGRTWQEVGTGDTSVTYKLDFDIPAEDDEPEEIWGTCLRERKQRFSNRKTWSVCFETADWTLWWGTHGKFWLDVSTVETEKAACWYAADAGHKKSTKPAFKWEFQEPEAEVSEQGCTKEGALDTFRFQ
eukprot:TRINITY_DN24019_c0_g1_i1.p1 TRINITY_DN24019_c0_g1~~TRINITY_DN24019_c0_g1_i1.p1  ORF type:complete len:597 (-),score=133.61 TRINITY_DN24019_c0_g1_i1:60-1820(-)